MKKFKVWAKGVWFALIGKKIYQSEWIGYNGEVSSGQSTADQQCQFIKQELGRSMPQS